MNITIIRYKGEPNEALFMREWRFWLANSSNSLSIRLTSYYERYKDNIRQRKWRLSTAWDWSISWRNASPTIPEDVFKEAKDQLVKAVNELQIEV